VKERIEPTLPGIEEAVTETANSIDLAPEAPVRTESIDLTPKPFEAPPVTERLERAFSVRPANADAPMCYQCGVQMNRAGSCHACPSCGTTSGCS
jgi:ribonucleoside-diphosphate reductase alpha chain